MTAATQTRFSHKLFGNSNANQPAPWTISEPNHCVMVFDKLKMQREQGRFCDVILKVNGRDFPAHRCVLASCSSWFDTKFKVHKTMKEIIEVESCKNYEVFHLVLTYMYTGRMVLEKHNVADILDISHNYAVNKLKNYCSEFLERNLRVNNCLNVIELCTKYHLIDLSKQTMAYINKNFKHIIQYHEIEKMSLNNLQEYLNRAWYFPAELVLRFITRWISQDQTRREESFVHLLHSVNWSSMDPGFISNHLDKEEFYYSSPESLLTILNILDKNNIVPNRFTKVYQDLQDKLLPDHDFEQELDDNNSFLSIAINSAVKDLENQEVDETFSSYILQPEPISDTSQYGPYRHPSGTDLVPFKQNVIDSGLMAIDPPYISPASDVSHTTGQVKQDEANKPANSSNNKNIVENHPFINLEGGVKSNIRIVPNVTYQDQGNSLLFPQSKSMLSHNSAGTSPVPAAIASPLANNQIGGFREQTQETADMCIGQYKPIGLNQTPEISNEYYRVGGGNGGYVTNSIKCSEHNTLYRQDRQGMYQGQDNCRGEDIQGDLYREGTVRSIEYPGDIYREPTVSYSSTMDSYRNTTSCAQTQYNNYTIAEDSSMVRSEFVQPYRETASLVTDEKTIETSDGQTRLMDRTDRQDKTDFDLTDYQILEQVINEHRMSEERTKYSADRLSTTKRYDPKHRALAQAFRKKEKNTALQEQIQEGENNYFPCKQTAMESCALNKSEQVQLERIENQEMCKTELKQSSDCQYTKNQITVLDTKEGTEHVVTTVTEVDRSEFITPDFAMNVKETTFIASAEVQQTTEAETSSPTSILQLSSCVQDPLQTPEKSDFYSYVQTEENSQDMKEHHKSEPQQLFLTPKEKYAKELSALNQTTVTFDINQGLETEKTTTLNTEPEKEVTPTIHKTETKVRLPSGLKILKSKKKMASQKRLILEHGEVRLTQKQRLKIQSSAKKLKSNDIFQPTDCPDKLLSNYFSTEQLIEESIDPDSQNIDVPKKKIIINRKDKLLAEHRSQNQNQEENQRSILTENKISQNLNEDKLVNETKNLVKCEKCTFTSNSPNKLKLHEKVHMTNKEYICPFCSFVSTWNKDHYQHIQVSIGVHII